MSTSTPTSSTSTTTCGLQPAARAALDLCLELVRVDLGAGVANEVARRIVIPPHRDGGQAQYINARHQNRHRVDSDLESWARTNLADVTVARLADHATVSARTLNRRFRERTGMPPQGWLHRERIHAAQELLETSTLTIETIARQTGLGSAANLRAHFAAALNTSPAAYRRTFSSLSRPEPPHTAARAK